VVRRGDRTSGGEREKEAKAQVEAVRARIKAAEQALRDAKTAEEKAAAQSANNAAANMPAIGAPSWVLSAQRLLPQRKNVPKPPPVPSAVLAKLKASQKAAAELKVSATNSPTNSSVTYIVWKN